MKSAEDAMIYLFQQGDENAFATIYHLQYPVIYYYARHFVPDAQDARDITTETFVKLWKLRANFDNIHKISTFLHITTRNACIDVLRHKKWKAGKHQQLIQLLMEDEAMIARNNSPMAAATRFVHGLAEGELLSRIYAVIEKLPPQRKAIFKMSFLEGMKNGEIAAHLDISVQTVQNQKTIALKFLRMIFCRSQGLPVVRRTPLAHGIPVERRRRSAGVLTEESGGQVA
ncbi:RNA polymerase sigma-70 factor [Pseudoflavitalea sp. X16]|uniref:RNA polymerase sigma-70 factor n=1 Tax=Paraflavitalea devenefica TaxID=2716334 RepID=UPI00141EAC15|nr:RNA polymerase sigma-70 factor [Paraflavitalea devenefica]NII29214.1 RNA polymerase sigma-70 factor [Paraflavitalea devenefica]